MNIFSFIILTLVLGTASIIYNNKFLLSLIIALEFLLLNSLALLSFISLQNNDFRFLHLSIFIIALSAVEASIGISILSFLSRNLSEVSLSSLNTLKT